MTSSLDAPGRPGGRWSTSEDGVPFRDLNGNGELDPYEDPRLPIEDRVADLLARMTLEEKAAQLFHQGLVVPDDSAVTDEPDAMTQVSTRGLVELGLTHFNVYWTPGPQALAEWHNRMQEAAEATRLGIPITISSDPRHGLGSNPATSMAGSGFSKWPDPIGLAATRDEGLVREFADVVRREYLAVGIRLALHPSADLATEPRWCRASGTFGEDAEVVARLVAAYIRGLQGDTLGPRSVACMTKHFPGGGPQLDGEDPHFPYGREQVYPGGAFDYHLIPFEAAIEAGTAQIMPYYGMPVGTDYEEVGFGFNRGVVTGLLRDRYGFDGVVCSDWGLLSDTLIDGVVWPARAWGVEHLEQGGARVEGDRRGRRPVRRRGVSGGRRRARALGPHRRGAGRRVRPAAAPRQVPTRAVRRSLRRRPPRRGARRRERPPGARSHGADRAFVLLGNDEGVLPLRGAPRVYLHGMEATDLPAGTVVDRPADADVAVVRIQAPYEPRDGNFIEALFHAGDLSFEPDAIAWLLELMRQVPTVVDVYLDRAAVMPEVAAGAAALLADFGATDAALLDVVFGRAAPTGKLPFELPSSMESVRAQLPDLPGDSGDPLFPLGHGLSYGDEPRAREPSPPR